MKLKIARCRDMHPTLNRYSVANAFDEFLVISGGCVKNKREERASSRQVWLYHILQNEWN